MTTENHLGNKERSSTKQLILINKHFIKLDEYLWISNGELSVKMDLGYEHIILIFFTISAMRASPCY